MLATPSNYGYIYPPTEPLQREIPFPPPPIRSYVLIYADVPLSSLYTWMSVMMFAFHSCRDTFSSYFHGSGNEEEMRTDISLTNLQSYFLFCMLNKYKVYYFEIRYRKQPCCSYGFGGFIIRAVISTKAAKFCYSESHFLFQSVSFFLCAGSNVCLQ